MNFRKTFFITFLFIFGLINIRALAEDKPSLKNILSDFFHEKNIYISNEKSKQVNIKELWKRLGISIENVSWKDDQGKQCYIFSELLQPKKNKIWLYYRTYESWFSTGKENEFVVLELSQFSSSYQLLIFQKEGDNWFYKDNIIIKDNGGYLLDLTFYETDDGSLLFSTIETGMRGTENFSNHWAFYKIIDGKARAVLSTLKSGYHQGWGLRFKREFESKLWPYFFTKPNISFTYFVKYQGDAVISGLTDTEKERFFDLFSIKKDIFFNWDDNKKMYVLDKTRSELNEEDIESIFLDGEEDFYRKYKKEIDKLKVNGNNIQKEWVEKFENVSSKNISAP
jgi:hypothetical protein